MAQAIQEYRACENSFQCTTFCNNKGFNDRVCKTVTVDESPNIDGTALVNRRVCLCSESSEFDLFYSLFFYALFLRLFDSYIFIIYFNPIHQSMMMNNMVIGKKICYRRRRRRKFSNW